ncbi:hypothetical protein [Sphingomonas sp. TREG-RG-20F-R18-01]|uniref:hypothetical protein n=1 Tax=Sphingomonas sp. TREG-RG-20F-R18-01 TaxID=2914982 RepID=UPI001F562028|nr:hypothetical protein [Sphingomonas sp. TREG-RG-20F-R18-01]
MAEYIFASGAVDPIPADAGGRRWFPIDFGPHHLRCIEIADQVVPQYRAADARHTGCTSHTAKRWSAAYEGAKLALDAGS